MPEAKDGASIGVTALRPSIDLAAMLAIARKCLDETEGHAGPQRNPFLQCSIKDGHSGRQGLIAIVDTTAVLSRVMEHRDFVALSGKQPFLRDVVQPRSAATVKLGAQVPDGTDGALKSSTAKLAMFCKTSFAEKLAEANSRAQARAAGHDCPAPEPCTAASLWVPAPEVSGHLKEVAASFGATLQSSAPYELDRLHFTEVGESGRTDEVARQMTSYENVQNGDRIRGFLDHVGAHFITRLGEDEEDVAADLRSWEQHARTRGSDLNRFMDFLDDEGLSRVRLAVSFRIMGALGMAARNDPKRGDFRGYQKRITAAYEALVENGTEEVAVDLLRLFGADAEFRMSDQMVKAGFWSCLPAWALWDTQLFEARPADPLDSGVQREVCYYFKVNGQKPADDVRAFIARVEGNCERLKDGKGVLKALSELLMLDAAIPGGECEDPDHPDPVATMRARCAMLMACKDKHMAIDRLRGSLLDRGDKMDSIAVQMVEILRAKQADSALRDHTGKPIHLFVNIKDVVLNPRAIDSGKPHPLAASGSLPGAVARGQAQGLGRALPDSVEGDRCQRAGPGGFVLRASVGHGLWHWTDRVAWVVEPAPGKKEVRGPGSLEPARTEGAPSGAGGAAGRRGQSGAGRALRPRLRPDRHSGLSDRRRQARECRLYASGRGTARGTPAAMPRVFAQRAAGDRRLQS